MTQAHPGLALLALLLAIAPGIAILLARHLEPIEEEVLSDTLLEREADEEKEARAHNVASAPIGINDDD